jgi:hypothetical protein
MKTTIKAKVNAAPESVDDFVSAIRPPYMEVFL